MGENRRYIPEGEPTVVEVTNRTVQGRFLLRPSLEMNEMIVGALARAQRKYGVAVHGYVFLSNHYHLTVTVRSAKQLAQFVGYFQSKVAKEVCRLYGWSDKVWARRYKHIVVFDEGAQHQRLAYLLENSCKEGLVESPLEWPGVHCAKPLVRGKREVRGTWFNRTKLWAAKQRTEEVSIRTFMEPEILELTPMPVWAEMSEEAYASHVAELVEQVERATSQRHRQEGTEPLGAAEICRQDPLRRPVNIKKEAAPFVHATTKAARLTFRSAYNAFVAACATATERLRATGDTSSFPAGAFLPPLAIDTG